MGSKPYRRCQKCKITGCPNRDNKNTKLTYCVFFSRERKPYPKKLIKNNDWKSKIEELKEMNKQ